jgi:hypothetical protein
MALLCYYLYDESSNRSEGDFCQVLSLALLYIATGLVIRDANGPQQHPYIASVLFP